MARRKVMILFCVIVCFELASPREFKSQVKMYVRPTPEIQHSKAYIDTLCSETRPRKIKDIGCLFSLGFLLDISAFEWGSILV